MPADDNIFGPAGYGPLWLVLGVVAGILGLGLLAWCLRRVPTEVPPVKPVQPSVPAIKARYLSNVEEIEREFTFQRLDERELHHRLSWTVRHFAADLGQPQAVAMTATLLKEAGLDSVGEVVDRYQEPQFKQSARCDPTASCAVARAVIEQW